MSEIVTLHDEGCGHTCSHDPNKYPEGSLVFDSDPAEDQQHNQQHNQKNTERKDKGKGKEFSNVTEPTDQPRWFFNHKAKTTDSPSASTVGSRDEEKVTTAAQPLCPECFNIEEDRICDTYAKRVKEAIKDCDTSGLTERETLQVCTMMEVNHENELLDFHAWSGYHDTKDKDVSPLVKTETLRGFLAIAKTQWTKLNEPRRATPRTLKKADPDSDNLALARAEWGSSRSASPGPSRKTGENKDSVAVARPRRDGTRFAFPVRIPMTDLREVDPTQKESEPERTISRSMSQTNEAKERSIEIAKAMEVSPKTRIPMPTRPSPLKISS